jgi:hypothetical protein
LNTCRFTIFSTDGVSGVKNFKYVFWIFVLHHVWSDNSEFVAFLWFVICALVQVLFLVL